MNERRAAATTTSRKHEKKATGVLSSAAVNATIPNLASPSSAPTTSSSAAPTPASSTTTEQQQPEPAVNNEEEQNSSSGEQNEDIFTVYLKTLTGCTLKLQISKADSNIEIKQLLGESVETCYITSYELRIDDKVLEDFADICDYPEITAGSTITMHAAPYDDKGARMHVYRLRELLDSKLDDMYLSTASVDKLGDASENNSSFPSFSGILSGEMYNDLAYAINCDMEFQQFIELQNRGTTSKKKGKKKPERPATTSTSITPQSLQNGENSDGNHLDLSHLNLSEGIPENYDSRQLFSAESFSMKSMENYLTYTNVKLPKCVKSITFSGWNPPTGNRKLCGDLFYLQIETLENKKFNVTATPNGFFVNSTQSSTFDPSPSTSPCHSHTLLGLLWDISPQFQREFPQLLAARTRRHPFEVTPVPFLVPKWLESLQVHTFDANRAEESLFAVLGNDPRVQQREWNEEYQSCKELPSGTMEERIIRDRTLFKIHCDFVDAATKGARAVVDKCLLPVNPIDPKPAQVYIQNNIFFSFAVDSKEDKNATADPATEAQGKKFEMDQNAYANANNDMKGVIAFNEADIRGVHTLASAIIDYRGYRVIAQSIIPGILQSDQGSKHVYGSIDDGKTFAWDDKYHGYMQEAAEKLHLKEHVVHDKEDKEFKLCCPVECKGIVGSDGRFYVLDLVRITPRDANFPNNNTAILRSELVKAYVKYKTSKLSKKKEENTESKENKEPKENKETKENKEENISSAVVPAEEDSNLEELKSSIKFNPDAFTQHKLGGNVEVDMQEVREISNYLKNTVVPAIVKDVMNLELIPLDGLALTDALHGRGVNMRYLGELAAHAEKQNLFHFHTLCVQEMLVRAARQEFNNILRNTADEQLAKTIEAFLNAFLGNASAPISSNPVLNSIMNSEKVKKEHEVKVNGVVLTQAWLRSKLEETVQAKFNFKLPADFYQTLPQLSTLRSFGLRVGLKILCRDYNFNTPYPFSVSDIQGLEPVVKHSTPKSTTASGLLEVGKQQLSMNRFESAYEFLSQAIVMFQQVKGPMNKEVANCFSFLATILFHASDLPQAILHQHKALVISKRVLGFDHATICHYHQLLGMLCHNIGQTDMALKHYLRAKFLVQLICGIDHPDLAIIHSNIAMMYQDNGDAQRALKHLKEALRINEKVFGPEHIQTASTHHSLAVTYSLIKQYKEALSHERKHYQVVSLKFGVNDSRTKESSSWLEHFTERAVQVKKDQIAEEQEALKSFWKQTSLLGLTPDFKDSMKQQLPSEFLELLAQQKPSATSKPAATSTSSTANGSSTSSSSQSKKKKKKK